MVLLILMGLPIKIKKAYSVDLVYTSGTRNYDSQIGIDIFSLPVEKYTIIMQYFWPENIGISLSCESSTAVLKRQTFKKFSSYTKILVQFVQRSKDTPDYLYFNIRGSALTDSNPQGYLVFYGFKGLVDLLPPQIYDKALETSMFEFDNGKMKMNMDLDMNGNSLEGVSVNSPFFIQGWYEKAKDSHGIYLNPVNEFQIIPFDCVLNKIVCDFLANIPVISLTIDVTLLGSFYQAFSFRTDSRKVEIDTNVSINKNNLKKIRFPISLNANLKWVQKAVFAFYFTAR